MDGEFYAEGVLNAYSFLGGILVYLKRAKQKLEAENGNMKSHWTGIFTAKVYLKRQQTQFVADIRKTLGEM